MADPRIDACDALGVARDATLADVKRAFRRLALELHPDRAGPATTARFQAIAAAYAWLVEHTAAEPVGGRGMLLRVSSQLATLLARGVVREQVDHYELWLDRDEVATGGHAAISTHAAIVCRPCGGAQPACPRCGGTGEERELVTIWLAVPAGVVDSTELRTSIDPMTFIEPVHFVVRCASR